MACSWCTKPVIVRQLPKFAVNVYWIWCVPESAPPTWWPFGYWVDAARSAINEAFCWLCTLSRKSNFEHSKSMNNWWWGSATNEAPCLAAIVWIFLFCFWWDLLFAAFYRKSLANTCTLFSPGWLFIYIFSASSMPLEFNLCKCWRTPSILYYFLFERNEWKNVYDTRIGKSEKEKGKNWIGLGAMINELSGQTQYFMSFQMPCFILYFYLWFFVRLSQATWVGLIQPVHGFF